MSFLGFYRVYFSLFCSMLYSLFYALWFWSIFYVWSMLYYITIIQKPCPFR